MVQLEMHAYLFERKSHVLVVLGLERFHALGFRRKLSSGQGSKPSQHQRLHRHVINVKGTAAKGNRAATQKSIEVDQALGTRWTDEFNEGKEQEKKKSWSSR